MKGFRRMNGVNWLTAETRVQVMVIPNGKNGETKYTTLGKMPLHWNAVRKILLR